MAFGKRGTSPAPGPGKPKFEAPAFKAVPPGTTETARKPSTDELVMALLNAPGNLPVVIEKADGSTLTLQKAEQTKPAVPTQAKGFREDIDTTMPSRAAAEIYQKLSAAYTDERGIHIETLMGAMAALTGEFALRAGADAHGQTIPANAGYVLGAAPDPYLYGGDTDCTGIHIFGLLSELAISLGADAATLPVPETIVRHVAALIGNKQPFPPKPSVPEAHLPREWSPNACPRHRQLVIQTAAKHGVFEPDEITLALGLAMILLFQQAAPAIGNGVDQVPAGHLLALATEIMIAVSRMAPLEAEIG